MFRELYHHSNQSSEHVGGRASSYQCVRQIKCLDVYYLTVQVYASCYRACFRQRCCGLLLPATVLPSVWGLSHRAALKEVQQDWGAEVKFWDKHTMKEYHIIQPSPLSSPFLPPFPHLSTYLPPSLSSFFSPPASLPSSLIPLPHILIKLFFLLTHG